MVAVDDFSEGTRFFLQALDKKSKPLVMNINMNNDTYPMPAVYHPYSLSKNAYTTSDVTSDGTLSENQNLPEITVKARAKKNDIKSTERFYANTLKTRETIEKRRYRNLKDIIRDIQGIAIKSSSNDEPEAIHKDNLWSNALRQKTYTYTYKIISTRGNALLKKDPEVVVLVDGLRTNEPIETLLEMDAFEIESVEYLQAWQAISITFGALHGVLNIETRREVHRHNVETKGTTYMPFGLTYTTAPADAVANTPGNYHLLVDIISPTAVQSYETPVTVE